jgi:hypothetical protein
MAFWGCVELGSGHLKANLTVDIWNWSRRAKDRNKSAMAEVYSSFIKVKRGCGN